MSILQVAAAALAKHTSPLTFEYVKHCRRAYIAEIDWA